MKTAWCAECSAPVYVLDEGEEAAPDGTLWWVERFECGHDAAVQR